jgi:hypothetical protein
MFVESFDFSTKEKVAVNCKANSRYQIVTESGRQLPLSCLVDMLLPVGDSDRRLCE